MEEISVLFKLLYAFKQGRVRPFCLIIEKAVNCTQAKKTFISHEGWFSRELVIRQFSFFYYFLIIFRYIPLTTAIL